MAGPSSLEVVLVQIAHKSKVLLSSFQVLLVDDCRFQRVLTEILLGRLGITPTIASGGDEAICLDGHRDFDLILMDIQMPGMDGFETTRRIREAQARRERPRRVPVIAYTACQMPLDAELMRRSGMNDAIQKPCSATTMRDCLLHWCPDTVSSSIRRVKSDAHA
ncbi:MAG: response regulator [Caldimonas sp.]